MVAQKEYLAVKFELSHDTLAKAIYDMASDESKNNLKIRNFVKERYRYYSENKSFLTKDDLAYISKSCKDRKQLNLTKEEEDFIKRSWQAVKRQHFWTLGSTIVLIVVLGALFIWAMRGWGAVEKTRAHLEFSNQEKNRALDSLQSVQRRADSLAQNLEEGENLLEISEEEKQQLIKQLLASRDSLSQALETVTEENVTLKAKARSLEEQTKKGGSDKLQAQIEKREKELKKQEKSLVKSQSRILSSKAHYALDKDKNPKLAFQLAREAYEMDPRNTEATKVLNQVVNSRNDYIGQSNSPRRRADQIIKTYKASYGKLSTVAKRQALGSN